ncbi:unnamed protein product [Phytophthora lilii]|uniref:Unnamed protein product n=1 Tax=Phytophthora lilii TaxID=2077276 RepID=A0A9W6U4X4_9STRA|nr:unnamed protein product [Phytophthora lilii]
MLLACENLTYDLSYRSISSDAGNVSIQELSSALHATELFSDSDAAEDAEQIDGDLLRYHIRVQYYADDDIEAIQEYVENTNTKVVSKAALAAFLRV